MSVIALRGLVTFRMVMHIIFGLMVVAASCAFMIVSQTSLHHDYPSIVPSMHKLAPPDIYKDLPAKLQSMNAVGGIAGVDSAAATQKPGRSDELTNPRTKRPRAAQRKKSGKKRPPPQFPVAVARDFE